jgi:hypothetical protein
MVAFGPASAGVDPSEPWLLPAANRGGDDALGSGGDNSKMG